MYDVLQQEVCAQGVGSGPTPMDDGAVRNAACFRCFLHGAQLRTWYLRGVGKIPTPHNPTPCAYLRGGATIHSTGAITCTPPGKDPNREGGGG